MKRIKQIDGLRQPEMWFAPYHSEYDAPVFKHYKDALTYCRIRKLEKQREKIERQIEKLENSIRDVERADYVGDYS